MKQLFIVSLLLVLQSLTVSASNASDILGIWQSAHGNGRIQIYQKSGKFYGKLVWFKHPEGETEASTLDVKNPDTQLRRRPVLGIDVFSNLIYKGNKLWGGGKVYDPKSGKTHNCQMVLEEPDKLHIRAFFGLAVMGKTEIWTRVE